MNKKHKIWVIGDSHTRSFSYNDNFIPIFVGEGREHCFINDQCLSNVTSKVFKITKNIKNGDSVVLIFGEPDTRFYLGRGWKPWKKKSLKKWKYWLGIFRFYLRRKSNVKKSFYRYCQLVNNLKPNTNFKLMILNITPSDRNSQNKLVDYFNDLLSNFCSEDKEVEFININHSIYNTQNNIVKKEFYGDPVHLNMRLQLLVEDWFIAKGLLCNSCYDESKKRDKRELKYNFKYNEQFDCYTL